MHHPGAARVGVRDLRCELASFIRRAADGERIVVSIDGHPVAQLGPLEPLGTPTIDDLAAAGLIRLPRTEARPTRPAVAAIAVDAQPDLRR